MEQLKGLEPLTLSLATIHSTTELYLHLDLLLEYTLESNQFTSPEIKSFAMSLFTNGS